ncbi:MAG: hypothetical protein K2X66_13825 [Cyanobacteria bacterium]|nr:hypothetical protein [Cyanobacteriota bacterium]
MASDSICLAMAGLFFVEKDFVEAPTFWADQRNLSRYTEDGFHFLLMYQDAFTKKGSQFGFALMTFPGFGQGFKSPVFLNTVIMVYFSHSIYELKLDKMGQNGIDCQVRILTGRNS